jgi:hypothetical protein
MSENSELGPQLDRATEGWIEHRRRLRTRLPEPTPEQLEAARLRLERDEEERKLWLNRIELLSPDQIREIANELPAILELGETSARGHRGPDDSANGSQGSEQV